MTRPLVLVVSGLAVHAAAQAGGIEAVLRPTDDVAVTLLREHPRLRECDLVVLASTAADGAETAERFGMALAKELRRETWWAFEPLGDAFDVSTVLANAGTCTPPPMLSTPFSEVIYTPAKWLVPGFVHEGKVALVAGTPGLGKSMLTVEVASLLSRGMEMPGEVAPIAAAGTLFFSGEDNAEDTIMPRLLVANADLDRIYHAGERPLRDVAVMLDERPDVRLVVVDPIGSYLDGTNSHNDAEVRAFLTPYVHLCAARAVSLLFVAHLNKNEVGSAINRINGSIGIVATARIAWVLGRDPDDDERVHVVPLKNNLARMGRGWSFRVESTGVDEVGRIAFDTERSILKAEELLRPAPVASSGPGALDRAREFLLDELASGPRLSTAVESAARAVGISPASLRRAREGLGLDRDKGGPGGAWRMRLPEPAGQGAQDAHVPVVDALSTLSTLNSSGATASAPDPAPRRAGTRHSPGKRGHAADDRATGGGA